MKQYIQQYSTIVQYLTIRLRARGLRAVSQRGAAELTIARRNEGEWSNCFSINLR